MKKNIFLLFSTLLALCFASCSNSSKSTTTSDYNSISETSTVIDSNPVDTFLKSITYDEYSLYVNEKNVKTLESVEETSYLFEDENGISWGCCWGDGRYSYIDDKDFRETQNKFDSKILNVYMEYEEGFIIENIGYKEIKLDTTDYYNHYYFKGQSDGIYKYLSTDVTYITDFNKTKTSCGFNINLEDKDYDGIELNIITKEYFNVISFIMFE